jgi:hypothetical protein
MRRLVQVLTMTVLAAGGLVSAQAVDATKILAQAREALGGDKKLAAITSFLAEGRVRKNQGNTQVPSDFEIGSQLPDKYFRRELTPATGNETFTGFNGAVLLVEPPPPGAPAPPPAMAAQMQNAQKARITNLKQDLARLMLGMFAAAPESYPLTLTYAGQAEAPQGKADMIDVKGEGNFAVKLFINSATHLPIMLSWPVPAPVVIRNPDVPIPPGAVVIEPVALKPTATPEEKAAAAKDAQDRLAAARAKRPMTEARYYYSNYQDAGGGIKFPFLLRRATGGETTEETTFDKFKINPKIDPKKFEVPK